MLRKLTAQKWIEYGIKRGWCGPPVCATHDGVPLSEQEEELIDEFDPCFSIIRLYDDEEMRKQVEDNHSPSMWRKSGYEVG